MRGKVCLITGGTNGIGKATAHAIALMDTKIVIVGRDAQKTADVAEELRLATGRQHIDTLVGDLSLMSDIRRIAETFKSRYERLDILINNVGAVFTRREMTPEGFEKTFALNHLGHFLLTHLLQDILIDTAPARVVSVASDAHRMGGIDFDNLQGEKKFEAFRIYQQSKLMNLLFTFALARRLEVHGVTSNALHPGFVGSGFGLNNGGFLQWAMKLARPFTKTPEEGAATAVYLASAQEIILSTGGYYINCEPKAPSQIALDEATQERLWEISAQLAGVEVVR